MKCMNGCLVFKLDDEQLKTLVKTAIIRLRYLFNTINEEKILNAAETDKDYKEFVLDSYETIKEIAKTLNEIDKEIDIKKRFDLDLPFNDEMTEFIVNESIESLYELSKGACAKRKNLESNK